MYALCECQSAVRSFCFHQHGFKNFTGLVSCHGEFVRNIHKAGMLCFATIDEYVVSRSSHPEVSREKDTPLRKRIKLILDV